ncbi:hypothetical protein [Crocinitomix algicola]|uniref:hypothetical protein n=1 Tax=Crocinitomix algicola TaxID=1740263 RepID=UPI00082C4D8B|nr:hypothetical protein [Crocinitomix algicola]
MDKTKSQIADFWEWFQLNEGGFRELVSHGASENSTEIIDQLDQFILGFGPLKWTIEEVETNKFSFTISPNNKTELLGLTSALVNSAPSLPHWTFFDSRQPTGKLRFDLYDLEIETQTVDAQKWKFLIEQEDADRVHLIIIIANTEHLDEETEEVAVDILLTSLIGERNKISRIESFEIVDELEANDDRIARPIELLALELGLNT